MYSEEAANKLDTALKNTRNSLEMFVGTDIGTTATGRTGLYAQNDKSATVSTKLQNCKENLELVDEGRVLIVKAVEDSIKRNLVAPIQSSAVENSTEKKPGMPGRSF